MRGGNFSKWTIFRFIQMRDCVMLPLMLSEGTVQKACELLRSGMSARKVALALGVSRGTIANIRHGRWQAHEPKSGFDRYPEGKFEKCPVCGVRVQKPCLVCTLRDLGAKTVFSLNSDGGELCEIDLEPEHRERYEEVRKWRQEMPHPHFSDLGKDHPLRHENRSKKHADTND